MHERLVYSLYSDVCVDRGGGEGGGGGAALSRNLSTMSKLSDCILLSFVKGDRRQIWQASWAPSIAMK